MAARTRVFRAPSFILSPSNKSIARHMLPPRPALKSLSGSGRLAPWEKVSFTLSLWALPTAMIPSRDHTGLPIHFHSSTISRSASSMALRTLPNVFARQSGSPAISWSMRSDGFMGSLYLVEQTIVLFGLSDTELPGVLRVQPLPAVEPHRIGANRAADGSSGEQAIQNIERNVPARGAPRNKTAIDVVPQ